MGATISSNPPAAQKGTGKDRRSDRSALPAPLEEHGAVARSTDETWDDRTIVDDPQKLATKAFETTNEDERLLAVEQLAVRVDLLNCRDAVVALAIFCEDSAVRQKALVKISDPEALRHVEDHSLFEDTKTEASAKRLEICFIEDS